MKSYRIRAWVVTRQNHEKKKQEKNMRRHVCENFCEGKQQKCAEFMSIFGGQNRRSRKGNETHNLLYYYYHP